MEGCTTRQGSRFTRRAFVVTGVTASGGFALALSPMSALAEAIRDQLWQDNSTPEEFNPWIVIEPDDTITIRVPQSELGNGLTTTLPMLIAEELECDWSRIKVEYASPNRNIRQHGVYGGMKTSSSRGVMSTYKSLQQAGASARERLIAAAAKRWNVAAAACTAANSRVTHAASARSLTYGALAADAAKIALTAEPAIRKPGQFKLVGKSVPRLDTPLKVRGQAQYGIDTNLPVWSTPPSWRRR